MKSKLFILTILVAASSVLVAQRHRPNKEGFKQQNSATPEQRVERMAKELGLTDAEKAKVLELFTKDGERAASLREEIKNQQAAGEKLKAEQATQIQEMRRAHDNELEKIIGKEKFAKLQTLKNENAQKIKNMRNKHPQGMPVGADNVNRQAKVREMMTPESRANHLKVKLELNDEQVQALTEVFKAQDLKNTELKKQKMQEIMITNDAEIEKIIGKEKMVKLKESRTNQIEKVNKNRKGKKA